ncbi:MAG: glycoside hydrolase family 5 protein [Bacteroidales bacterium]|nr:glycoside hydrolase family 5 protein [Bacteroidales bacterium]
MKKLFFVVLMCVLCFNIDAQVAPLHVQGINVVNAKNEIVNLRGVSFSWHNWWGQYYTANMVKELKNAWHCNIVRASIGVGPSNDYIKNPEYALKCLDNVVDEAIKQDLYVIIDFHSHDLDPKAALNFFKIQAKKYGSYPNVIFELFNEPVNQSWDELKKYAVSISKVIRKYSDNLILMGTPQWCQQINLAVSSPIEGVDNLMYTLHFYANTHKEPLRASLEKAVKAGVPVFVSECGSMSADGNGKINEEEFSKWLSLMEQYKLPMIFWSMADKEEVCSLLRPNTDPDGPLKDATITDWGKLCKNYLLEHNK